MGKWCSLTLTPYNSILAKSHIPLMLLLTSVFLFLDLRRPNNTVNSSVFKGSFSIKALHPV